MKFTQITLIGAVAISSASPAPRSTLPWSPPGPDDGMYALIIYVFFPPCSVIILKDLFPPFINRSSHSPSVRGPCPMLNTLANHGILPHSGKNLTLNATVQGLINGVNFSPSLGEFLFAFAMTTNPDPNATSFTLHQLGSHDILEHDASLR